MKRRLPLRPVYAILGVLLVLSGYLLRGQIREVLIARQKPSLPPAVGYTPEPSPVPATATAEAAHIPAAPVPTPTPKPTPRAKNLPAEVNLDVPFLLQAPEQNWVDPFEDACEEASELMVAAYYEGRKNDFSADEGERVILDVVAFEDKTYGHNKDTTSEEVVHTLQEYFGLPKSSVRLITSADDIRQELAAGRPVIVPAYGKALGNPNFRNGGPVYHMLVIKGYRADGTWITNDPGTRRGKEYLYSEKVLMDAIHDFNEGDVPNGSKVMIVAQPN